MMRRLFGMLPKEYSILQFPTYYHLCFKGYKTGIVAGSKMEIKQMAWKDFDKRTKSIL